MVIQIFSGRRLIDRDSVCDGLEQDLSLRPGREPGEEWRCRLQVIWLARMPRLPQEQADALGIELPVGLYFTPVNFTPLQSAGLPEGDTLPRFTDQSTNKIWFVDGTQKHSDRLLLGSTTSLMRWNGHP